MSGRYKYPPNVSTVQISPKCQDGTNPPKCQDSKNPPKCQDCTDIPQISGWYKSPQMSGQYRYPPNVRTVQISPKCQDST
ncbi:unnamed protein product, partial [Staurois parvus]